MPNLSFGGHLAGIVVGTLQLYGFLNKLIPRENYLLEMDNWRSLRWLSSSPSFVATTCASETLLSEDLASTRQGIRRCFNSIAISLCNVLETIKVAIFGRGAEANSNIQLGGWGRANAVVEDDDDEWGGLPPKSSEETSTQLV